MVSASLEWCMIVPAVTEVCLPQPAHSQVHGLVCSSQALLLPQPGQTKPCGQRPAKRYLAQAALSGKRCWNSIRERGKSVTADHPERLMFALCSTTTPHTPPQPIGSPDAEAEAFVLDEELGTESHVAVSCAVRNSPVQNIKVFLLTIEPQPI